MIIKIKVTTSKKPLPKELYKDLVLLLNLLFVKLIM